MDNLRSSVKNRILLINLVNNLGWTLILTLAWTCFAAFEVYREAVLTVDHLHVGLLSHLHSGDHDSINQHLVSSSETIANKEIASPPNIMLLINKNGTITGSTVTAWQGLNISNSIFASGLFNNKKFNLFKRCIISNSTCQPDAFSGDFLSIDSLTSLRILKSSHMGIGKDYGYLVILFNHADAWTEILSYSMLGLISIGILTFLISAPPIIFLVKNICPYAFTSLQKDSLTNLNNRAVFTEQAIVNLESAELRQIDYVLAIIDIDNFKKINDSYGHAAGDIVLSEFSLIMDQTIRQSSDLCARFGGEEFSLLLKCNRKSAATILERLRLQIEIHNVKFKNMDISTTISIGAASTEDCGYNIDYLLMKADAALYVAKNEGKNQVTWHETT